MDKAASLPRQRNLLLSAEILSGDRSRILHDFFRSSRSNHFTAMLSGTGSDIHNHIRFPHRVFIMLYHDDGVAEIPKTF